MTYRPTFSETSSPRIKDTRTINYLRISVTDRCNLACRYCVPKDTFAFVPHEDVARYEEMLTISEVAVEMGITKIRITGGEPLVRKGLAGFIAKLSAIEGVEDIAITTNGVLLESKLDELIASGVTRLNISLDTLSPETFKKISGKDFQPQVWRGIVAAHERGISPLKLNMVPLRGINDHEIGAMARLIYDYPFHVRFIEYMPMGNSRVTADQQILIPELRKKVEEAIGPLHPVSRKRHDGPARRFTAEGALGEIGFISPISSHFCRQCNRLRLTSTGMLRPCLLNDYEEDALSVLRKGGTRQEIRTLIQKAITQKPLHHSLDNPAHERITAQMFTIGG